ncbi:hypothetical protein C0Q70_02236 [Pomacea canaliculata]|uniref:Uncharacterized protein n=1 Tax=Pomacea canaliculata TaxID=400727 RepID=A0A2T7Q1Q8_POMCA|nr:hypothetical protein C0Q70_02236 [Pomacea canaliculata]
MDPRMIPPPPPVSDAMGQSLTDMDAQMRDILERTDLSLHDKANLYQQTLWRFLSRTNDTITTTITTTTTTITTPPSPPLPPPPPVVQEDPVEAEVLGSVPKSMKKKAERLLQHFKRNPELTWNDRGEILYEGQAVKNSNLVDLVNDVLRKQKRARSPRGWETFAKALRRMNVSQDLVGHPDRWKFITEKEEPVKHVEHPTWETL